MGSAWSPLSLCAALAISGCTDDEPRCVDADSLWGDDPAAPVCVEGDLVISGREASELGFAAQIEEITGSLLVYDNPNLEKLPRWDRLARVGGFLSVTGNPRLESIRGFPALGQLTDVYIGENPRLVEIELGERVVALRSLFVALNPRLARISEWTALEQVAGDVRISHNPTLQGLRFPALGDIGGSLEISNDSELRDADFPALSAVGDETVIADNTALESIEGLASLARTGLLVIQRNDALREVVFVTDLAVASLFIEDNPALERIDTAPAFQLRTAPLVVIAGNERLATIAGFSGVAELSGLEVSGNAALRGISAWPALERVDGFNLEITFNPALEGPNGWFPGLLEASEVWIFGNASLPPSVVEELLQRVTVERATRVGDNLGEETALGPCPWPEDGVCDGTSSPFGPGTGLCATDPKDCGQ